MIPRPLLHLEGGALLGAALLAYYHVHGGWALFAMLFLVPDTSMAGYLINVRIGAPMYNLLHTTVAPLALAAWSVATAQPRRFSSRSSGSRTSASTACSASG